MTPLCNHCWHKVEHMVINGKAMQRCCWCGVMRQTNVEPEPRGAIHGPHLSVPKMVRRVVEL